MLIDIAAIVASILAASSAQEMVQRFSDSVKGKTHEETMAIHAAVYPQLRAVLAAAQPPPAVAVLEAPEGCDKAAIGDLVIRYNDPAVVGFVSGFYKKQGYNTYRVYWFNFGRSFGDFAESITVIS